MSKFVESARLFVLNAPVTDCLLVILILCVSIVGVAAFDEYLSKRRSRK